MLTAEYHASGDVTARPRHHRQSSRHSDDQAAPHRPSVCVVLFLKIDWKENVQLNVDKNKRTDKRGRSCVPG